MPPNGSLTITNPLVLYRSLVATKQIAPDPAQHRLALHLQTLYENLKDYEPTVEYSQRLQQLSRAVSAGQNVATSPSEPGSYTPSTGTRGLWTSLLASKEKRDSLALTRTLTSHETALHLQSPKGLMLHGEVGTGKSMLIDLFAGCLPNRKKRRWHFNTFMLDTVSRLEQLRKYRHSSKFLGIGGAGADEYSLLWLARDLIETSPILFLDEFQLPDRAASKILSNLMTSFFQLGGVLIATSNRMPEELAKAAGMEFARPVSRLSRLGWSLGMGGVTGRDDGPGQRGEFSQFLEVLRARCEVWEMEGKKDYRRISGEGEREISTPTTSKGVPGIVSGTVVNGDAKPTSSESSSLPQNYLIQPSTDNLPAHQEFTSAFNTALSTALASPNPIPWKPATLTVYGRALTIPRQHSGTAQFTFEELCGATLGPADYITLASSYHTFIVTDVPVLTFLQKNEARRLITLLDALYEARCRLLITAAAAPDDLFFPEPSPSTTKDQNENTEEVLTTDAVHPETYSEIHQDLTSPFRPNISSYSGSLSEDALEDDPPNRFRRPGTSFTDERRRLTSEGVKAPDFANIGGLTGEDERFAVKRGVSRIWEMCSQKWWSRDGDGWWRPLPLESRHWEHGGDKFSHQKGVTETQNINVQATEGRDARDMGFLGEEESRHQELFQHGASPLRTAKEPPPKIGWTHVWGTVKWGPKAGAWGKGVEGLEERKGKKTTDSEQNSR